MASPEPCTTSGPCRKTVAIVGAGAAGALVAIQLCETAARRRIPFDLLLIDPAPEAGRGTAYSTLDPRHRLNVPAGRMSCYPDDPGHFVRWLCHHGEPGVRGGDFAERYRYGAYLADTLGRAIMAAQGVVGVRRLRTRATGCHWTTRPGADPSARLELADGGTVEAHHVVLATGPSRATAEWAPADLRGSDRFIADPWAPGALDAALGQGHKEDVLLVGTGLTSVDIAMTLDRPGRTVHTVSRGGRLPQPHAVDPLPAAACTTPLPGLSLAALRAEVRQHISRVMRTHGDWRPAVDGLRPVTAEIWASMSTAERAEFMARDGSLWNTHRHRMPPATAESVGRMRRTRRMRTYQGRLASASARPDGSLTVSLATADGPRTLPVGWVVDCTGPGLRLSGTADPLWRSLLDQGAAVPGPLSMGVATDHGRLRGADGGATRPLWTLGAPRRGELWETTAIPEIREQAAAIAEAVLDPWTAPALPADGGRAPRRARRPMDTSGFPLSTHAAAATAYRLGVDRLLKVRAGAPQALRRSVALDPGFALGHAALALIGHECGADVDVSRALADARRAVRERADDYERSFVDVVSRRVLRSPADGDAALLRHLEEYPGDALALAVAVPTIAFSGLRDLDGTTALRVVERTAQAHGGGWFHTSLLAFMRQEQGRYDEAGTLAEQALAAEPASGHAMHALAHVHYERGDHEAGRERLERWLAHQGRGGTHRAHFSWHAALHELALEDTAAVRRRWAEQLSPGKVHGVRALVDSGSLLWRARLAGAWQGPFPIGDVLDSAPAAVLERPATAFVALHAAIALTAAGDLAGLRRLRVHALRADEVQRSVIAPLCTSFEDILEERWAEAARGLERLLPRLPGVGGSAAQREIVEETLLFALVSAGHRDAARDRLEERLDRRSSPHDRRRLTALSS
ncbi:FAD/NAD(P)-binding protein [Streptomyces malaysiensis]|uniref:FAD/NAD(P)-binding protein n=1 Tax=Streptomyces malaysiensis TaxID=92644 RepID=UPI00142F0096|nr:FAD/NAD(P)-binding protein [Streptomyces malaysiensis]